MELNTHPIIRKFLRHILRLEDKLKGRAFPGMIRARQISFSHCGPAVLTSLFSLFGVKISQKSIVKSIRAQDKIKKFGLNLKDMARASKFIAKGKFDFWQKANGRISDIDVALNKYKHPVGVEWQGVFYEDEDEDNGHYAIITQIDKKSGTLRMADPFYKFVGLDRKFKINLFFKRWWDVNTIKKKEIYDQRVMFVITKKGETWPKKLGMVRK